MANEIIRPADLPQRANPVASEVVASDSGTSVAGVTWEDGVNAGRPLASQSEAEAGTNPTKAMTPLTTNQAVTARVGVDLASKAQGDLADTAVQPGDLAAVATTGEYGDLSGIPALGSAAATDATDYATAAQGTKADTALQSAVAGVGIAVDTTDPNNPVISSTGTGVGDMLKANNLSDLADIATARQNLAVVAYVAQTLTDAQKIQIQTNIGTSPRGHIQGLTVSNNTTDATNDIDIEAGEAANLTIGTPILMKLASAITKRLDANWAPGTGNGMRYSGAAIANTSYHLFLAAKAGGADPDIYAYPGLSSTATVLAALQAETGGSDYLYIRRIGSIVRKSGAILPFTQRGDNFTLTTMQTDYDVTDLATTLATVALSVPTGIQVLAKFRAGAFNDAAARAVIFLGDGEGVQDPVLASKGDLQAATGLMSMGSFERITDTSGQIRVISTGSGTTTKIHTFGWVDDRGRSFTQ